MTSAEEPDSLPPLSPAFRLPPEIEADRDLALLYREWLDRLGAEAMGLPMHQVQEFLLERIASRYVIIKFRELHGSWVGVNSEAEANKQWLELVKEWNKVLASGQQELRNAVLKQAQEIALEGIQLIEDSEERKKVRLFYKEKFAAIGS